VDRDTLCKANTSFFAQTEGDDLKPDLPEDDTLPFDFESLLQLFDGDAEFLREMADIFLKDAPAMMDTIREAIQVADADTLRRTAHSLKGMLINFQFEQTALTAYELESAGCKKKFDNLLPAYKKLAKHLERVCAILRKAKYRMGQGCG